MVKDNNFRPEDNNWTPIIRNIRFLKKNDSLKGNGVQLKVLLDKGRVHTCVHPCITSKKCIFFDSLFRSLCEGLLKKKVVDRLGCSSGRRGVGEIKIHPWFNTLNWRRIEAGRDTPPFEPDPHAVYAKVNKSNT